MTAPATLTTGFNLNPMQEKILNLLGQGFPAGVVASSVGCEASYVSQLISLDWFAQLVQEKKFAHLQKHTAIDAKYDSIEEKLLEKLEKTLPLIIRPGDITKTLQTINGAKRRGVQSTDPATLTQNIVQLTLPNVIIQKFVSNAHNQIVEVQDDTGQQRTLVTVTSGSLERLSRETIPADFTQLTNGGSAGSSEDFSRKTIAPERLNLPAEIIAAQEGLNKSIRSSQPITADDL